MLAAFALTLIGTVWSGWLAFRKSNPRGVWSRLLFEIGFVLCVVEMFVILWGALGIGAA